MAHRFESDSTTLSAVIAVGNQKGGVGKSTVTVNLAAALGQLGHRVLVIDLDPSGGATHHLGIDPYAYQGTVELLEGQGDPSDLAIAEDMPDNVSLIAARPELSRAGAVHVKRLGKALDTMRPMFEFILLDTAPNPKSPNTFAAYTTADWFLFVTSAHVLSIRGLTEGLRDVAAIRHRPNPDLEILGVVFNAVDTRTLALRDTQAFIARHVNLRPFAGGSFIPQSVYLNRAAEQGETLFQIKSLRAKPVTRCFERIAQEIAERCFNRDRFLASCAESQSPKRRGAA